MREIKFRAWNGKEMLTQSNENGLIFLMGKSTYREMLSYAIGDRKSHDNKLYLMQYTGLKDKNGKEIYEGDIIQSGEGFISVYDFHYGSFGFKTPNNKRTISSTSVEVIGNIYENPEML